MASKLQESLRIPVNEAEALYRPITFGGHSLGGSLALLLAVLFRLQHKVPPELLRCCTFGSPPVLSHGQGGGGEGILKARPCPFLELEKRLKCKTLCYSKMQGKHS